jgi:DNA-binding NarL/FixJ family response regulator
VASRQADGRTLRADTNRRLHAVDRDLIRVIREVAAGHRPRSAAIEARLVQRATRPQLTPRETQVIGLMAQAMRNKEIAAALGVSEQTAQVTSRIFSRSLKSQIA